MKFGREGRYLSCRKRFFSFYQQKKFGMNFWNEPVFKWTPYFKMKCDCSKSLNTSHPTLHDTVWTINNTKPSLFLGFLTKMFPPKNEHYVTCRHKRLLFTQKVFMVLTIQDFVAYIITAFTKLICIYIERHTRVDYVAIRKLWCCCSRRRMFIQLTRVEQEVCSHQG